MMMCGNSRAQLNNGSPARLSAHRANAKSEGEDILAQEPWLWLSGHATLAQYEGADEFGRKTRSSPA